MALVVSEQLGKIRKRKVKTNSEKNRMDRSYELSDKGTIHVINFLKLRITTAGAKIRRYNQGNLQYQPEQHVQKQSEAVLQT